MKDMIQIIDYERTWNLNIIAKNLKKKKKKTKKTKKQKKKKKKKYYSNKR